MKIRWKQNAMIRISECYKKHEEYKNKHAIIKNI